MSRIHGIDARKHAVRNQKCSGCIRFVKLELKDKSPTFRLFNWLINPIFNKLRDSIVTEQEIAQAKQFAAEAFSPPNRDL